MTKQKAIEWKPKLVDVAKIKPTPNNYKIKSDLGAERLSISMKLFGNASTVIVNTDFHLIDGNSRLEEEKKKKTKKMWVMWPSRKLTPKEYAEFSAMFDFAKAGEVDMDRIEKELGTTAEFFERYKMNVPMHLLGAMGAKASPETRSQSVVKDKELAPLPETRFVQLFFTAEQEIEFRKHEARLAKKFKTSSTHETVLKAFKLLK